MSNSEDTYSFSIDLPVRNEWKSIDLLRTSVQNCFAAVFSDIDGCHTVSIVTGELLENAMKYGSWQDAENPLSFRLTVRGNKTETIVSVENPISPGSQSAEALKSTIDWINKHESAEEAYRARLLEIASADDEPGTSKLGLVRVAYEGNCKLEADVDGNTLTVTARLSL